MQQTTPADSYFGSRVRSFRNALGWTQEELAQALADRFDLVLHQTTVAKLEGGSRPTNVLEMVALASVLGVSYGELLPPPIHVAHPSEEVKAAESAFVQAQALLVAAEREAAMAGHRLKEVSAMSAKALDDARRLEARYHAVLKADEAQQRRAEKRREVAADTEGEVD